MSSVDVVVPCYRYGRFLPAAVASALDQPGIDVRVLVIDDASPDDSADVARNLSAADPRVEVLVHPANKGHIATYNEGLLEWCSADYSVLLSADDALTPGALTRAVAYLDSHPESGFVYGPSLRFHGLGAPPPLLAGRPRARTHSGSEWLYRRFIQGYNPISSPEVVVRTSLQQQVGGYDPSLPHSGDLEMWLRLASRADVGQLHGVHQAYYRVHGISMSVAYREDGGLTDLRQRWAAFAGFLRRTGAAGGQNTVEQTVRRTLAGDALWAACHWYASSADDLAPAERLVAFAEELHPGARQLPEWHALRLRRRLGPRRTRALRRALPDTYLRPLHRRFRAMMSHRGVQIPGGHALQGARPSVRTRDSVRGP
jgi:glycosyltransferase involved in cell wall biosynthesis